MAHKEDGDNLERVTWHSSDPRHEIPSRATVVILRPGATGAWEAGIGYVETDHGYYVHTSFGGLDNWPEGWVWAYAPERQ